MAPVAGDACRLSRSEPDGSHGVSLGRTKPASRPCEWSSFWLFSILFRKIRDSLCHLGKATAHTHSFARRAKSPSSVLTSRGDACTARMPSSALHHPSHRRVRLLMTDEREGTVPCAPRSWEVNSVKAQGPVSSIRFVGPSGQARAGTFLPKQRMNHCDM